MISDLQQGGRSKHDKESTHVPPRRPKCHTLLEYIKLSGNDGVAPESGPRHNFQYVRMSRCAAGDFFVLQMLLLSVCAMHIVRMACIATALFGPLSRNRSICAADKLQDIGDVSAGNRLTNKYMGVGNEMFLFLAMLDQNAEVEVSKSFSPPPW